VSGEIDVMMIGSAIKSHLKLILGIVIASVALLVAAAAVFIPTKYKSFTVITIPSRYFQQPVVEDIIPSVGDPAEMRSLRENLMKTSLNREFLETERAKYNLFPPAPGAEVDYEISMQKLLKQYEIISLGPTSFQISYLGSTAEQTLEMTKDAQKTIVDKLWEMRRQKLLGLRDNLLGRVDSLGFNVKGVGDPISSSRPDVVRTELQQVQGILASLQTRFSAVHPLVKSYKQREKLLKQWLKNKKIALPKNNKKETKERMEGLSSANLGDVDRYSDLLKRVDRMNIVLEYEAKNPESLVDITTPPVKPLSPLAPNFRLVVLWGFLLGMLISMIYISIKRMAERVQSPTAEWAVAHKIQYLGRIPNLRKTGAPTTKAKTDQRSASADG
jgi:capsular polysaccharide biosynthesis protein